MFKREYFKKGGGKDRRSCCGEVFFSAAVQFWLNSDEILDHRYHFRPEFMVLRENVKPDYEISDGKAFQWEGITIHPVATPGHTDGSFTYIVDIDGTRVAFTGDLIYGPGKIWEFYSLQKRFPGMQAGYWGFGGAVEDLENSLEHVLSYKPRILIPSHGVIMRRPREAVALLKRNLSAFMRNYFQLAAWRLHHFEGSPIFKKDVSSEFAVSMLSPLPREDLPTWIHRLAETSWYIKASDGKIFLFDCGFPPVTHELDRLMQVKNIAGISGIWISHYHDDHVESVNEVRRKYKCKVYAQKEIVDILQNPNAYSMPALYPETIHVDYPLSEGETVEWKGYKLTGYFFPGQTLYHGGLLVEFERKRVFMSGDSFANWAISEVCSYNRNFLGKDGAVAGYERCIQLLLKLKPDVLVAAHYGSVPFSWKYLSRTLAILKEQAAVAARLFPWDDPNFGLDPRWVRAYPYRQSLLPGQPALVEARIYNHSDRPCRAYAALRVPRGWRVTNRPLPIIIDPHSEGSVRLMAVSPIHPLFYREVLGLAVNFDGRNLGEIAETIVDYLEG